LIIRNLRILRKLIPPAICWIRVWKADRPGSESPVWRCSIRVGEPAPQTRLEAGDVVVAGRTRCAGGGGDSLGTK